MLGGLAIIATAALSRRPLGEASSEGKRSSCAAAGAAGFCDAVAGLRVALRNRLLNPDRASVLPPPGTTGAVDPAVSQANIGRTICRPGYARAARPSYAVTDAYKRHLMDVQHPGERMADYELDHLIPISIGGAPFDARDLWLQPRRGQANAGDKNDLAYLLWRLVCEHRMPLRTAQHAISTDWTQAYATYATPENIARYHFRHKEVENNWPPARPLMSRYMLTKEVAMPQNIAEFRIIGRVGKITARERVTYVSVAANYNRRDGDDWKTDTLWNSVVCFSNVVQQVEAAGKGDLVHITGRVRESSHGEANDVSYRTELIADTFSTLSKAEAEEGR